MIMTMTTPVDLVKGFDLGIEGKHAYFCCGFVEGIWP